MKKMGYMLLIIGCAIIGFYSIYIQSNENKANANIDDYIKETSKVEKKEESIEETSTLEVKEEKKNPINYTAIIEIPSIGLKSGIVDSTKNFYSINYAISADKSSNYPDEYGNFILYAHSGNSSIAFFKKLDRVNVKDDIYIFFNGVKYQYIITNKYNIQKNGKLVIEKRFNKKRIILITCDKKNKNQQIVVEGILKISSEY